MTKQLLDEVEDAALTVKTILGSGWSETIYQSALQRELSERGVAHHTECTIPVMYKGAPVGRRRPDLFVMDKDGNTVILELKAGTSSGHEQISEYVSMARRSDELTDIFGGMLVGFNESLDIETVLVAEGGQTSTKDIGVELIDSLSTGIDIYQASVNDNTMEVQVDTETGDTFVPIDDGSGGNKLESAFQYMAVEKVKHEVSG